MAFMNRIRKILPTRKVEVNELERKIAVKSLIKLITAAHKIYSEKLINESPESTETEHKAVEKEFLPEEILCPYCDSLTIEGLDYCDNCGREIQNYP